MIDGIGWAGRDKGGDMHCSARMKEKEEGVIVICR